MVRRFLGIALVSAILAPAVASGAEFHVSARVDIVPTLAVRTHVPWDGTVPAPALLVEESQERCLEISVVPPSDGEGADEGDLLDRFPIIRIDLN